jgi:hypothetical protein
MTRAHGYSGIVHMDLHAMLDLCKHRLLYKTNLTEPEKERLVAYSAKVFRLLYDLRHPEVGT